MSDDSNLALWVVVWIIVIGIVLTSQWRKRLVGVGLTFAFLGHLGAIHWLAAVIYLMPWYVYYVDIDDEILLEAGFRQGTYAIVAFAVGSVIIAPFLRRLFGSSGRMPIIPPAGKRLAKMYTAVGLLCFLALRSPIGRMPTVNALVAVGMNLLVVGLGLMCWDAWHTKRRRIFVGWLFVTLSFPLFTIVFLGFAGVGAGIFLLLLAFISSFVRPRWKLIAVGLLFLYLGISFYGTYARDRDLIREVVWSEEATLGDRVEQLYLTLSNLEWFSPFNPVHLFAIDHRLNMNSQVGSAVDYLQSGYREYAYGKTIWQSIIGLIPRAVWPGKPVVAGGSEMASYYTGIEYSEGTSVGLGLVTEFYVNFGAVGVVLGFLCLGVLVAVVDWNAGQRLLKGDWRGFTLWFLPGMTLLGVGGSLVEMTSGAGAAVVTALLVNRYLVRLFQNKKPATPFNKAAGETAQSLQP